MILGHSLRSVLEHCGLIVLNRSNRSARPNSYFEINIV